MNCYIVLYYLSLLVPDPEVYILPIQEVYMIGDTVELICTVAVSNISSSVNVHVQWISTTNNDVIKETTLSTSSYTINQTYSLTIENVSISDAGQYVCRASNTSLLIHGDAVDDDINVNVMCKLLVIIYNYYNLLFSATSYCHDSS